MPESANQLWLWIIETFASGSLLAWGGAILAFLVFSALVLAYTRFGQQRPVMTCAGLSVLAHLLLLAMASQIVISHPIVGYQGGETASINVMDQEELDAEQKTGEDDSTGVDIEDQFATKPWNEFQSSIPETSIPELERPTVETELVIERTMPEVPELPPVDIAGPGKPISHDPEPDVASENPVIEIPTPTTQMVESPVAPPSEAESQRHDSMPTPDPLVNSELANLPENDLLKLDSPETDPAAIAAENVQQLRNAESPWEIAEGSEPQRAMPTALPLDLENNLANSPVVPPRTPGSDWMAQISRPELRSADHEPMPVEYSLRSSPQRQAIVARHGGSAETELAVKMALEWLAANQSIEGRWDSRKNGGGIERRVLGHDRESAGAHADMGVSGLALLAFLSGGHTHMDGPHMETVRRGLEFISGNQGSDGNLYGDAKLYERMYCHSMATLALGEAVAMTGDDKLRSSLRRAVEYSIRAQSGADGGWRYQPGDTGDMSQFGWVVLGLRSAELGGIEISRETREGMNRFLHQSTRGAFRGLGCYRPGEGPSPTMTAEALVCRYLLEKTPQPQTVSEAQSYIMRSPPTESHINYYYWYYGTMAMYQSGGPEWELWNKSLTEILVSRQTQSGIDRGCWPADGVWAGYGGKVYSTAMATLCLEVYYRYMPFYEALRSNEQPFQR